jgi:uncharacterized protein YbcI
MPHSQPKGATAVAISNEVVRLVHDYTGRGPTKARTHLHDDLISVVLQDTLTMGERSLVRDGRAELVLAARRAFQETMRTDMIAIVERNTNRKVLAFLSDNHIDPDIAVESFVLTSPNGEGATGAQAARRAPAVARVG